MSERLDRIEKNMEELFRGIRELRESMKELRDFQMQTEREIRELREGIAELRETQKESQIQSEKEMRELRESQKQTEKEIRELRESQKETDRMIRENQREIDKLRESQKETDRFLKEVGRKLDRIGIQLGELGIVQGEIGEELFYRNLKSMFKKRGMVFNSVRRNLRKRRDDREYDIVATNGTQVLVVEVKNKLRRRHIDLFLEERLPEFKEKFPQYKDKELLGAVGALVVKDDVARYAEKKGLFVLTQTDDGGATILNKERFKPKVFG